MSKTSFEPGFTPKSVAPGGTNWIENIFLFGIPAAAMYVSYYNASPLLASVMPLGVARLVAGSLVMGSLIIAGLVGVIREDHPPTFPAIAERLRLRRMNKRTWLWAVCGLVIYVLLAVVANTLVPVFYEALDFKPPIETAEPWGLSALPIVLFALALNILGEEEWWRGYILPRQELQFGSHAWIWHGILWACFHVFKWWTILALLFVCLVVPFVAQRTRNTVPGILSHLAVNGLGIAITVIQLLVK